MVNNLLYFPFRLLSPQVFYRFKYIFEAMAAPAKGSGLDKNNKYDRQLRLWGDHGQSALESARVCLINATATGTEIMKNLILPGIGSFTIVDGHKVQGEDVGSNFFLVADSIGKSRAQVATELLAELNDDVAGDYLEENVDSLLEKNPAFFNSFTTVIATQLPERTLLTLGQLLWENNIPLVVSRSYGFIGYLRLVIKEHTVIESHPDNSFEDLRLDRPFTGLEHFCDSLHLDEMNKKDHSHTPWLVLIYKYLQVWKQQHEGKMPSNYREKNAFKELIRQGVRISEKGVPEEEENFDEAVKNVNSSLHTTNIPSEIKSLFDNPACTHLSPESSNFWILVRAIKEFTENEGAGFLPLRGSIPDMTSDSERYIQLQNVYKEQAERDVSAVVQHVQRLLQECEKPADIKESDIKMACRNSAFLRVVHCRSLEEEYSLSSANVEELGRHVMEEEEDGQTETDDVVLYILLRAADRFFREFDHYPGVYDHALETDISKLKSCVGKLLHDWQLSSSGIKDDYIQEMCRYGASELHTVAAFMGGVTAQEVIKLVTRQFEPVNNTYIYNAQRQTSTTIQL